MKKTGPIRLSEVPAYAAVVARLDGLKTALEQASRGRDTADLWEQRARSDLKAFLRRAGMRLFPPMTEADFDEIVRRVPVEGIPEELVSELGSQLPQPDDPYDAQEVNRIRDARRVFAIYKRAVELQEREVLAQKKAAVAQISSSLQEPWGRRTRKVADAALQLAAALGDEQQFFEYHDPEVRQALRPQPFPIALNSDPAVFAWIALALGITEAQVQTRIANLASEAPIEKGSIQ